MGGKSGTTTQSVSIPPEVLARYNAVNARAEQVARTPFQPYTGQFVAGLTPTQQAGIQATSQYSQAAQPYYQAATGQLGQAQGQGQQAIQQAFGQLGQGVGTGQAYAEAATGGIGAALQAAQPYQTAATQAALAGGQQLTPENINIGGYMSPYTQAVADTTFQALRQQQQQEMAGQTANAIRSGAFGGDRAGLVAANLARQQQLGTAQAMAPIYQQGYGQALGTAMTAAQSNRAALQNLSQQLQGLGQQGYGQQMGAAQQIAALGQQQFGQGLGAAQQLGALGQQQYGMGAGTAQQLAALGSGAQQSALQGAQAQLGAGTLEQQTQQADLTARYQQFLQERGYPFQVAQFLANIAMGTGALSGSTTTTTQPMPFFSDRRVKDDVKEIGKTHDGLPIYSYKYKGDDATRIGLMAQDVEKKHPEAVYDMGGVKGVDYKQATENSERPERYSGGLVPASMGGAVTEPGAYARGGYAPGGLVDANDIQALIAMQQEALGPFGESGLYGGSQHQTPFANAKGIVPQTRLHTPKLMTAGPAPRMPESGAQQALSAFDTAMGMKDRYEKVKEMVGGKDTAQQSEDKSRQGQTGTDRKNLAGPDIVPDRNPEEEKGLMARLGELFFAHGGVVSRDGFAVGGSKDPSLPYEEDDKSPYKYFPTEILETEKPELAKPSQAPAPTSQSGVGLGTLLGLFFNQGGVVPRGHLQTGGVYDPTMGREVSVTELTPEKIAELNKEDVYSRELQPAAAPRFRVFERIAREEGAKGVKPTELYRSPERSAMLDLTMPAGAPRAKPYTSGHNYGLAVDYSNTTPENYDAIRKAAAATGLTAGLDFSNVDPPHVQLGKGSYGGLYGKDVVIDEGFGGRSQKGVVPAEAQEAAYAAARTARPDLPATRAETASGSVSGGEPSGVMPSVKSFLAENQGWLVPFGAGLKGMVQSRSPFLGGALLEGLGTGMEAVGPAQQQLAELDKARAAVYQTLTGISGTPTIGQFDKSGRLKLTPTGEFLETGEPKPAATPQQELQKTQEATIEAGKEAVQQPTTPIKVMADEKSYRYDVAPTANVDQQMAQFGFTGQDPARDIAMIRSKIGFNPTAAQAAQDDQKIATENVAAAQNTGQIRRETEALTKNLMGLSPDGQTFLSSGPLFDERVRLANMYNWLASFSGVQDRISDSDAIDAKQITDKITVLLGTRFTSQQGFRGQELANSVTNALPGGAMSEGARLEMLASMWVANQEAEDFRKYYENYIKRYGTALGVNKNFQAEMGSQYQNLKKQIKEAMVMRQPQDENGNPIAGAQPMSYFQLLVTNPATATRFDQAIGAPGVARVFVGG